MWLASCNAQGRPHNQESATSKISNNEVKKPLYKGRRMERRPCSAVRSYANDVRVWQWRSVWPKVVTWTWSWQKENIGTNSRAKSILSPSTLEAVGDLYGMLCDRDASMQQAQYSDKEQQAWVLSQTEAPRSWHGTLHPTVTFKAQLCRD